MNLSELFPGQGGGLPWVVISSNTTAERFKGYMINASGGNVTLTLPASPAAGDIVGACDAKNQATSNTITIGRNGQNIEGVAQDLTIDINGAGFVLGYVDSARGWKILSEANGAGNAFGFNWSLDNEVTTNQSPTTGDLGTRYLYTPATAADRTLTLPSVASAQDGQMLAVTNESEYIITVAASDTDTISWPQLYVTSIEILPNTHVTLRYDHSQTKWDITTKAGNQVRPAGTVLYWLPDYISRDVNTTHVNIADKTQRHFVYGVAGWTWLTYKFPPLAPDFDDASSQYLYLGDSADWDVFGSTSNDCIVCGWVYCDDAIGSNQRLLMQYEDANNRWELARNGSGNLELRFRRTSVDDINISGGTLSQSTWHHVLMAKIGVETGIYIDGSQVAYDASFTADTFSGTLDFGRYGAGSNYLDGKMQDWCIVYQNIFNAAPNSTPNDTIDIDTNQPLRLVI